MASTTDSKQGNRQYNVADIHGMQRPSGSKKTATYVNRLAAMCVHMDMPCRLRETEINVEKPDAAIWTVYLVVQSVAVRGLGKVVFSTGIDETGASRIVENRGFFQLDSAKKQANINLRWPASSGIARQRQFSDLFCSIDHRGVI